MPKPNEPCVHLTPENFNTYAHADQMEALLIRLRIAVRLLKQNRASVPTAISEIAAEAEELSCRMDVQLRPEVG
jgi:hypothetical protein